MLHSTAAARTKQPGSLNRRRVARRGFVRLGGGQRRMHCGLVIHRPCFGSRPSFRPADDASTIAQSSQLPAKNRPSMKKRFDCLIIGGGHNGLVAAAYLAKAGKSVCVLERRHVLGGCSVTEELWPGFKVSVAAYVISLFQPQIIRELRLKQYGLEYPAAQSVVVHAAARRPLAPDGPGRAG